MKKYLIFLKFLKPYKKQVIIIFFSIFFYTIFNGISIGMIQPLFDYVLVPQNKTSEVIYQENKLKAVSPELLGFKQNIKNKLQEYPKKKLLSIFIIIILIAILFKALFFTIQSYFTLSITQKLLRDIRNKLYEHLQILPLDYFRRKQTGAIISHITNDITLLDGFLSQGVVDLILNGLQVLVLGTVLFYLNWQLAFFSIITLVLTIYPVKILSKKLYKLTTKLQEKTGEITGLLNESFSGIKTIKSFCQENPESEKFKQVNQSITKNLIRSARINSILIPLVEFMATVGFVVVLLYGGKEIINQKLSSGEFILFLGVFLSMGNPLKKLSQVTSFIQQGASAIDRIFSIFEFEPHIIINGSDKTFVDIKNDIQFENICFNYSKDVSTLDNINIKVKKGEVIAFIGPSGAGKSTLMDMLPRFLYPISGKIEIDGIDINQYNVKSLRDKIGIVSQEVILFHDSVLNNIAYGKQNASQKEIEFAAQQAYAHEFIIDLPEGYNTLIGERGSKLSGGQRQRISIARAILKNPPILILDEATSSIDLQSEKVVQTALHNLMQDKTTLIIAHRFSSIKHANKIIIIISGKIEAIGTHDELIQTNNYYKHLWNLQNVCAV